MKITLICIGKLKEKYLKEGIAEYSKRLSRYTDLSIIELPDEPCPENASESVRQKVKEREGKRILEKIPPQAQLCTLEIKGKSLSSEQMAERITQFQIKGTSHLFFVIGGSIGLSKEISTRANLKLSFSSFTFPHQLFRLVLLEQIYRWFKIIKNEPYHK